MWQVGAFYGSQGAGECSPHPIIATGAYMVHIMVLEPTGKRAGVGLC
jgi:hypothetical protein